MSDFNAKAKPKKPKRPGNNPPKKGHTSPPKPKPKPPAPTVSETAKRVAKANKDIADNRPDVGAVLTLTAQFIALWQVNQAPDVAAMAHRIQVEAAVAALVPAGKEVELSYEVVRRSLPDTVGGGAQALVPVEGTFNVGRVGVPGMWPAGADVVKVKVVGTGPTTELPVGPYQLESLRLVKDAEQVAAEFTKIAKSGQGEVSDRLLKAINIILDERIDRPRKPPAGGGGGGPLPEPAADEEVDRVRERMPDRPAIIDVPIEPSPIGIASTTSGTSSVEKPELSKELTQTHQLTQRYYEHMLEILNCTSSSLPPVPNDPRFVGPFTQSVDVKKLRDLDSEPLPSSSTVDGLTVLHRKLLGAVSEKGPLKYRNGGHWVTTWAEMQLTGRFREVAQCAAVGDLCVVADPAAPGGQYPAIVLSADATRPREVLAALERANRLHVFAFPATATVLEAWSPAPVPLFDETNPIGKFWGPSAQRLRVLLDRFATENINGTDLVEVLVEVMYAEKILPSSEEESEPKDGEELRSILSDKLHFVLPNLPLWPGSVVFGRRSEVGVVLADGWVLGTSEVSEYHNLVTRMPMRRFSPSKVWYPC